MKKVFAVVMGLVLLLSLMPAGIALADKPDNKGNGLPIGEKTFNFNVIGVTQDFDESWTGGQGKRIFISRNGITRFYVQGGDEFAIMDRDGTDGNVGTGGKEDSSTGLTSAGIILPYDEGRWDCQVFVRLLGPNKPGDESSLRWASYYWDGVDTWVEIDTFTLNRDTKFSMKNSLILYDGYEDILWKWDQKNNFRICQFRIVLGAPPLA